MGLSPHEYYCMSPLEFYYASKGYMNKYWKEWDMVRHQMYTVASTVPSKKKLPRLRAWFPLPTDGNTHEESDVKEMFRKLKEKINGNKRTTGTNNS